MKTQILTFVLLLATFAANAQNCFWAKKVGGGGHDAVQGMTSDSEGNIYISGYFESPTLYLDSLSLQNGSTPNSSYKDIFIAKYDSSGNVLWAKSYGDKLNEKSNGIAIDRNGNIYIAGYFISDTLILGNDTLINGANPPTVEIYCAKLDNDGNPLWARMANGQIQGVSDVANALAVDTAGNLIITGYFQSDSIRFGNITLYKQFGSSANIFIAKYDQSGNILWATNGYGRFYNEGSAITIDSSCNIYVTGRFEADSVTFGNITLYANSVANGNFYIVKFDPDGNVLWAEKSSGTVASYGYAITSDGSNVYASGLIASGSHTFGSYTIQPAGSSDIFIVKYNSAGVVQWAKGGGAASFGGGYGLITDFNGDLYMIGNEDWNFVISKYDYNGNLQWSSYSNGSPANDLNKSITINGVNNVYVAGNFYGPNISFENAVVDNTNSGLSDGFIAHNYYFSSAISLFTHLSCYGTNDGSATVETTGGMSPLTFSWSNGDSVATLSGLSAGVYSMTVTDVNECSVFSSVTITEPPADSASICMVTVDSLSQYNIIVWDKTLFTSVDSFIVYREIATGNYQPIARIPYDSLSQFIDTVAAQYFPNTGDPNAGTYRYKLQVHDTCGSYSDYSPYHNTIYFLNNSGTFYWTLPYTIEGGPNPVSSYILLRDDNSTGNWQPVASVAGTQQTISDPLYVIYQNTASWRVKTQWGISCMPTKSGTNYSYSLSNVYTNVITAGNEHVSGNSINIYPNPADNEVLIVSTNFKIQSVEIQNILGVAIAAQKNPVNPTKINIGDFPQGVYFVHIQTNESFTVKKILKQ